MSSCSTNETTSSAGVRSGFHAMAGASSSLAGATKTVCSERTVEATLVGRSSVETAYRQVAGLAKISREAPRWSSILSSIATQLPDAASLTAFRARGDSIFLDGVADHAAPVFDDVARTPGVSGVRATAPVRRESIEGEAPLEHFSIGAQIGTPAPTVAAPARRPR